MNGSEGNDPNADAVIGADGGGQDSGISVAYPVRRRLREKLAKLGHDGTVGEVIGVVDFAVA
jgi:hypothetical protein